MLKILWFLQEIDSSLFAGKYKDKEKSTPCFVSQFLKSIVWRAIFSFCTVLAFPTAAILQCSNGYFIEEKKL